MRSKRILHIPSVNAGASDNILNNISVVSFDMLITPQMVETHILHHWGVSNIQVRQLKSSGLVQCGQSTKSVISQRMISQL